MPTSASFDSVLQQPSDWTRHRTLVAAATIFRLLATMILLLTGCVVRADDDAVFWGTIAPTIRITPEAVLKYFTNSTTKRPNLRIAIGERHVRVYGDTAINSGYYTSRNVQDGQEIITPMRFTFVFHLRGGRWMIVSHHSSRMPAP